jgi:hypothetical protein
MITAALRWLLVLPPVVPVAVYLAAFSDRIVDMTLTERYFGLAAMILFFLLLPIAAAIEIAALSRVLLILAREPSSRTVGNIACATVGIAFLALAAGVVVQA